MMMVLHESPIMLNAITHIIISKLYKERGVTPVECAIDFMMLSLCARVCVQHNKM